MWECFDSADDNLLITPDADIYLSLCLLTQGLDQGVQFLIQQSTLGGDREKDTFIVYIDCSGQLRITQSVINVATRATQNI